MTINLQFGHGGDTRRESEVKGTKLKSIFFSVSSKPTLSLTFNTFSNLFQMFAGQEFVDYYHERLVKVGKDRNLEASFGDAGILTIQGHRLPPILTSRTI